MSAKRTEERLSTPVKKRAPKKAPEESQAASPQKEPAKDQAKDQAKKPAKAAKSPSKSPSESQPESAAKSGASKSAAESAAESGASKSTAEIAAEWWASEKNFEQWRKSRTFLIERCLEEFISNRKPAFIPGSERLQKLCDAISYTLLGGGKRVRGLLALATAEAVCGKDVMGLPAAMAVELIHAYSLIHDDLPALDNDDTRRGRPSNHLAFGESTAILAGDALQAMAFEALLTKSDLINVFPKEASRYLSAAYRLSTLCGISGLVGGQFLDLAYEGASPGFQEVMGMEILKTGHLIAASMLTGAILGGASPKMQQEIFAAGSNAGLAFQIRDDLLNYYGDPLLMGKSVGTDAKKGKASLPAVMDPEEAEEVVETHLKKAIEGVRPLKAPKLEQLLTSLVRRDR